MVAGFLSARRLSAAGAAALVATLCLLALASSAPAQRADRGSTSCGAIPDPYTGGIRVKHVSCSEAKRVIATYTRRIIKNLQHDWSLEVHGLDCDLVTKYYYGDIHRCTGPGGREVRFWRGSEPPPKRG
ncbi:MAG TPA: hypothetical protein VN732_00605 [Solirubrobacterales bacterium]|nr:hypothetical protein [Solirubrobacterales bacterium]